VIRVDTANPYNENAKEKLPVIILIHGFLGLNSFDGMLATIPSHQYIAAAMHYGSIPNDLPPSDYSHHIAQNIDAVVGYFGEKGHPVYILAITHGQYLFYDDRQRTESISIYQKYLHGRIGANPFFGEESKHAILGFLDTVVSCRRYCSTKGFAAKTLISTLRRMIPLDTSPVYASGGYNSPNG
jgi:hypothetical protein